MIQRGLSFPESEVLVFATPFWFSVTSLNFFENLTREASL